jgi:hypothetical protein
MTACLYLPVVHIEKENKESGKQSTAITDGGRGVKAEGELEVGASRLIL